MCADPEVDECLVPLPPGSKRSLRNLVGLTLLAVVWVGCSKPPPPVASKQGPQQSSRTPARDVSDPRLTIDTPFRNVRPEVAYVGDETCARCHQAIALKYSQHPMARSMAPVAEATPSEKYEPKFQNPFRKDHLQYTVSRDASKVFHQLTQLDEQESVLFTQKAEVHYTVGSGANGRTYLINRDGYLFESPITWYPRKGIWDISPGYQVNNQQFRRVVTHECLFCHCNHAQKEPETHNRYAGKIFNGFGIGCERCHGPGELHVRMHERDEKVSGIDFSIVNPRHLDPYLKDSICQQCHLEGQRRILPRGRETFDFRPGLPWHAFMSIFTRPPEHSHGYDFAGHFEQVHSSKCFQSSRGKMTCTSCHDPHEKPAPAAALAWYRSKCLQCHQEKDCSETMPKRRAEQDSCVKCHMPLGEASIEHTAIADHRILRIPEPPMPRSAKPVTKPGQVPLVYFHRDLISPNDPGIERDLGIALVEIGDTATPVIQESLGRLALPKLEQAVKEHPDDIPALVAKANALWMQRRLPEAAAIFDDVLARVPRLEAALDNAGTLALEMRRWDKAIGIWERAIRVNPYRWRYRHGLTQALAHTESWNSALHEARKALELDTTNIPTRQFVIAALLKLDQKENAKEEFRILMAMNPPEAPALRKWFDEQLR